MTVDSKAKRTAISRDFTRDFESKEGGATATYAQAKHEPFVVPLYVLIAAPAAGLLIGAIAGLYPAAKASRLSPTEALRTA